MTEPNKVKEELHREMCNAWGVDVIDGFILDYILVDRKRLLDEIERPLKERHNKGNDYFRGVMEALSIIQRNREGL